MYRALLLMIGLVALAGCGGPSAPPPAPSLLINLDGSPASGLLVQLVNSEGKAVASGTSDKAGKAIVRQGDSQPPAAGSYKLVVVDTDDGESNPMERAKATKSRLPASYGKPATTKASVTIEAGKMDYSVELQSKP
jgi:hypothetical protein